jgi:beta-1,4-N-acetylglucosaminyltransferase
MIFLTVGTQFPFDRLVKAIDRLLDDGILNESVFAQIGSTTYKPKNFPAVPSLDKHAFDRQYDQASAIISHGGTGVIMMAIDRKKPLLAVPRLRQYGEVVNDHQVGFSARFAALGCILVALGEGELPAKVVQLRSFTPAPRHAEPELVAQRIISFLSDARPAAGIWRRRKVRHTTVAKDRWDMPPIGNDSGTDSLDLPSQRR